MMRPSPSYQSEWLARREIVEIGRRVHAAGFVAASDGNISVRLMDDRFLATPSGSILGELRPQDLIYTDFEGRVLSGTGKPTSEWPMHAEAFRQRPDIHAVLHAHPPITSGFTFAGRSLAQCVIPEVLLTFGVIPTTDYATPGTGESARVIRDLIFKHDALILQRHGSITVGRTLKEAFYKLEKLEHAAQVTLTALQLGGIQPLSEDEIRQLGELRQRMGLGSAESVCRQCAAVAPPPCGANDACRCG